jgi:RimJ/RimL family protein N-acetyltransferase
MSDLNSKSLEAAGIFPHHVETANLILRPYRIEDAGKLLRMISAESARLAEVLAAPVLKMKTLADAEALIAKLEADWREARQFVIPVWNKKGSLVGECYLGNLNPTRREADIGIFVFQEFEGQAIAREALEACIFEAGRSLGMRTIHYWCDADNERSQKLAHRLGFFNTGEQTFTRTRRDQTVVRSLHFKRDLTTPAPTDSEATN